MPSTTRVGVAVAAVLTTLVAGPADAAPVPLDRAGVQLLGEAAGDLAGHQVESGDLDGDGVDDLVIGAYGNKRGGAQAGAVYVEYGPVRRGFTLSRADAVLHTDAKGDFVGEGPMGLLDLDGDGAHDLVLGAPGSLLATQAGSPGKVGEAFLLYGGRRLQGVHRLATVADAVLTGVQHQDWLGFGAAGVGDLDADGFEDLALGAPATAGWSGALYLFYGSRTRLRGTVPVTSAAAVVTGTRALSMLGYEATGGDLDGDGASDLVVTSYPLLVPDALRVHVFYGGRGKRVSGPRPAVTSDATLVATRAVPTAPWLAVGGDLTGDRFRDLVVSDGSGRTAVFAGGARLAGAVPINPDTAYAFVGDSGGSSVTGAGGSAAVGDVTGDRRPDLVLGDAGAATVSVLRGPLHRGPTSAGAAAVRTYTAPDSERAGAAVAVGDVTGDRLGDLVVGAPGGSGRVYVVRGRR